MTSLNNLSNILLQNLNNYSLQIKLNENEIKYLKKIINIHPKIFIEMSTYIYKIINNNTINLENIPQIIVILTDAYRFNIIVEILQGVDLIHIIDYTINSILDSKILYLPHDLYTVKLLVDSSIELLRIKIPIMRTNIKIKQGIIIEEKKSKYFCCFNKISIL